jgi:hypothetical protein
VALLVSRIMSRESLDAFFEVFARSVTRSTVTEAHCVVKVHRPPASHSCPVNRADELGVLLATGSRLKILREH